MVMMPYVNEVNTLSFIAKVYRGKDNLEDIINQFGKSNDEYLRQFAEFAERVRNKEYSRLSDYFVDMSEELLDKLFTQDIVNGRGEVADFIGSVSRYAFSVNDDEEVKYRAMKNLARLLVLSGTESQFYSAIEYLKNNGMDKSEVSLIEAYRGIVMDEKIGEFIKVSTEWLSKHKDDDITRLWRASAYTSVGDWDNAKKDMDILKDKDISKSKLYALVMMRISSKLELNDGKEFEKWLNTYNTESWNFPIGFEGVNHDPKGLYG